jgi:hypothetical protein
MQTLNDVKQPQYVQWKTIKSDCIQVTAEKLDKNDNEDQAFQGTSPCPLVIMYQKTWIFTTVGNSYIAVEKNVFICIMKSRNIPRNLSVHSNVSATCIRGASEKFLNGLKFLSLYLDYHNFKLYLDYHNFNLYLDYHNLNLYLVYHNFNLYSDYHNFNLYLDYHNLNLYLDYHNFNLYLDYHNFNLYLDYHNFNLYLDYHNFNLYLDYHNFNYL